MLLNGRSWHKIAADKLRKFKDDPKGALKTAKKSLTRSLKDKKKKFLDNVADGMEEVEYIKEYGDTRPKSREVGTTEMGPSIFDDSWARGGGKKSKRKKPKRTKKLKKPKKSKRPKKSKKYKKSKRAKKSMRYKK